MEDKFRYLYYVSVRSSPEEVLKCLIDMREATILGETIQIYKQRRIRFTDKLITSMISCGSKEILNVAIDHYPESVFAFNIVDVILHDPHWAEVLIEHSITTIKFIPGRVYPYRHLLFVYCHDYFRKMDPVNKTTAMLDLERMGRRRKLWTTTSHQIFPPKFKETVRLALLARNRSPPVCRIPRPVLYMIFNYMYY